MIDFGKEIKRTYDEFGPIQVIDDGAKRILMFGENDEQGCILKQTPTLIQYDYIRAMLLVLLFERNIKHCLVLGLGSGALTQCLWQNLSMAKIHVIELRREVIKCAYSYFQLPRDTRLKIMCDDGGVYISKKSVEPYDLIFSDIYHSHGMDDQQVEVGYIKNCMANLSAQGWLIINYWVDHQDAPVVAYIKENCGQVWVNEIDNNNWIVMASQSELAPSTEVLKGKAQALSSTLGFSLKTVLTGLKRIV